MRRANIFIAVIVIAMAISVSLSIPVFAQAGPSNPNANTTTAYNLLQQEANQTGGISKATLSPLSLATDLPTYNQGDTIVMVGHVRDPQNATAVTLRVFNDLKNLIAVAQLLPSSDGSFTKTFLATGPLWKDAGNYTIVAQYGLYTNASATLHYNGGTGTSTITQAINSTYPLQSGSQIYNIPYIIKGGTVSSMSILASQYTLEIAINTNADGSITVTLPRNMIDSKVPPQTNLISNINGTPVTQQANPVGNLNTASLEDSTFIVTVNGKQVTPTEVKNQYVRILSIPFHNGDSKIDIVGTVIVPEFGPIAALVLAIAIISIIAVSAKTGLRFIPKY